MTTEELISPLQNTLLERKPGLAGCLGKGAVTIKEGEATSSVADQDAIKRMLPDIYGRPVVTFEKGKENHCEVTNIGVILSGGQAPGGHNVIAGLFDALKVDNPKGKLYGFLKGPAGLIEGNSIEITDRVIDPYRNTGGFDIIGSGRTKLETQKQFEKVVQTAREMQLDGIVVVGGDDSNTNAAMLAQYVIENAPEIKVIGVPKTIDGDLKNEVIEASFGFDTASRMYSELVGNIARDAKSARKYWHFIKLMGRSASHITLEVALQTRPNMAFISEEVLERNVTLDDLVDQVCEMIIAREKEGMSFGVVLIPEGLIEFIPEMKKLIGELNSLLSEGEEYFKGLHTFEQQAQYVNHHLTAESSHVFSSLPADIQHQMLSDRDDHGNLSVSTIETDKLLVELCHIRLSELKAKGSYNGKFAAQHHFLGYEGRCVPPTNFDANYTYNLGYGAYHLLNCGLSGYMVTVQNTWKPIEKWTAGGVPITMMMNMEERKGKLKPVIQKALVDLNGLPFKQYIEQRAKWALHEDYRYPGPIQYFGPDEVCNAPSFTMKLERGKA